MIKQTAKISGFVGVSGYKNIMKGHSRVRVKLTLSAPQDVCNVTLSLWRKAPHGVCNVETKQKKVKISVFR